MAEVLAIKRRTRKLSLAFMGEGWDECFIEIYRASVSEGLKIDEIQKQKPGIDGLLETIKLLFVAGQGLSADGEPITLKREHLDSFDADALLEMSTQLVAGEQPDPKASTSSGTTTPETEPSPSASSPSSTASDSDSPPINS